MPVVVVFQDDDRGFLEWLDANRDGGWALNVDTRRVAKFHRAYCRLLRRIQEGSGEENPLTHLNPKVCGCRLEDLEECLADWNQRAMELNRQQLIAKKSGGSLVGRWTSRPCKRCCRDLG